MMKRWWIISLLALGVFSVRAEKPEAVWPEATFAVPEVIAVAPEEIPTGMPDSMRAFYLKTAPWKGKESAAFAIFGLPEKCEGRVPAVILLHGGGGTAFYEWVRLWNARGFAAVSIDLCGYRPAVEQRGYEFQREKSRFAWPDGWDAAIGPADREPISEQWLYRVVAMAIQANSLLRSMPEIDPDQIGALGISWGGLTVFPVMAADPRLAFGGAVYGAGFLDRESPWLDRWRDNPSWKRFLELWDPAVFAPEIRAPFLMANSTNDHFFSFEAWNATADRVNPALLTRVLKVGMGHSYPPDGDPAEMVAFFLAATGRGLALPRVKPPMLADGGLRAEISGDVAAAELIYTVDRDGEWRSKTWRSEPAEVSDNQVAINRLPEGAAYAFFNIRDSRGNLVSSRYVPLDGAAGATKP